MQEQVESDHPDKTFADLRQRLGLGKSEVVHGNVAAGQDDGHHAYGIVEVPRLGRNVDKLVGNALYGQLGVQNLPSVDAHRGIDLELSRHELPNTLGKRLTGQFVHFGSRKAERTLAQGLCRSYLLADHHEASLQETVFGREQGHHVAIELEPEQHDDHADEVGKEESCKLRQTDVFP